MTPRDAWSVRTVTATTAVTRTDAHGRTWVQTVEHESTTRAGRTVTVTMHGDDRTFDVTCDGCGSFIGGFGYPEYAGPAPRSRARRNAIHRARDHAADCGQTPTGAR